MTFLPEPACCRVAVQSGRALALALVLALASLAPGRAQAEVEGKARVVAGDRLQIAGQRFRLEGIAAPALDQVCERAGHAYACGKVARAVLWDLIGGREVTCQPVADASTDALAIAANCLAGETNLNESMVATGWARADPAAAAPYGALEDEARQARRGLWTGTFESAAGEAEPAAGDSEPSE